MGHHRGYHHEGVQMGSKYVNKFVPVLFGRLALYYQMTDNILDLAKFKMICGPNDRN